MPYTPTQRARSARTILQVAVGALCVLAPARGHAQRADTVPRGREPEVTLPGLTALGIRPDCSDRDDPRAHAIWRAMRARYSGATDSVSMWTELQNAAGWAAAERLLRFDTMESNLPDGTTSGWNTQEVLRDSLRRLLQFSSAARVGDGRRGMAGRYRREWEQRIQEEGYARLIPGINADLTQAWSAWAYPPLEAELASHFLGDEFARRHQFALTSDEDRITISFCAKRRFRSRPYIVGALVLGPDTTLARAHWRFRTPAPDEQAGGEVEFAAHDRSVGAPLLMPVRGRYYRRHGVSLYFQRQQTYSGWRVGEGLALPRGLVREDPVNTKKPTIRWVTPETAGTVPSP